MSEITTELLANFASQLTFAGIIGGLVIGFYVGCIVGFIVGVLCRNLIFYIIDKVNAFKSRKAEKDVDKQSS